MLVVFAIVRLIPTEPLIPPQTLFWCEIAVWFSDCSVTVSPLHERKPSCLEVSCGKYFTEALRLVVNNESFRKDDFQRHKLLLCECYCLLWQHSVAGNWEQLYNNEHLRNGTCFIQSSFFKFSPPEIRTLLKADMSSALTRDFLIFTRSTRCCITGSLRHWEDKVLRPKFIPRAHRFHCRSYRRWTNFHFHRFYIIRQDPQASQLIAQQKMG